MHIVVTLKQVYDPNTPAVMLQVGADGKSIDVRSGMSPVLNGYDANAIEEAVRIKEKNGGKITVLCLGDDQAVGHIRRAIAMGADAGVHLQGPTGLDCDSTAVAGLIAAAIKKLGDVTLVLSGKASSDTDAGQTHLVIAERLGFASVSPVKAIIDVDSNHLTVDRIGDGLTQRVRALLPLVLGISNEINKPRAPGLKGVMLAKKVVVPTWNCADLGIGMPAPGLRIKRLYIKPAVTVETTMISLGSPEADGRALAERLVEDGVI